MLTEKILLVDDDANILAAYQRGLRKQFSVDTAQGGEAGLAAIAQKGPYAVVLSDMRMPGMSGIQFLRRVAALTPETVRMVITGYTDLQSAVDAVNEGNVFRFLTKPCTHEVLSRALTAGLDQYRLIQAEKDVLEQTLRGAVKMLTDVLAMVSPTAFGRAGRVRTLVQALARELQLTPSWQLEIAALLSQVGCVAVPEEIVKRAYHAIDLPPEEKQTFDRHRQIGHELIACIPRLEGVAKIVAYQENNYDGSNSPTDAPSGDALPLEARLLKVALDADLLEMNGCTLLETVVRMKQRKGCYDPTVLAALEQLARKQSLEHWQLLTVAQLRDGMLFAEEVLTTTGILLVSRGQIVSPPLRHRLELFVQRGILREPIKVSVPC